MNSGNVSGLPRLASSLDGNCSSTLRFDGFAELGGDARARFERADTVLFGMPETNAELATAFLPM